MKMTLSVTRLLLSLVANLTMVKETILASWDAVMLLFLTPSTTTRGRLRRNKDLVLVRTIDVSVLILDVLDLGMKAVSSGICNAKVQPKSVDVYQMLQLPSKILILVHLVLSHPYLRTLVSVSMKK
jgi:hypothetical protein